MDADDARFGLTAVLSEPRLADGDSAALDLTDTFTEATRALHGARLADAELGRPAGERPRDADTAGDLTAGAAQVLDAERFAVGNAVLQHPVGQRPRAFRVPARALVVGGLPDAADILEQPGGQRPRAAVDAFTEEATRALDVGRLAAATLEQAP